MLVYYWTHGLSAYRVEIESCVQCLVDLADDGNVVAADNVQTQHHLFDALLQGENALVRLVQNDIDCLVETLQSTNKVPSIRSNNRYGAVNV